MFKQELLNKKNIIEVESKKDYIQLATFKPTDEEIANLKSKGVKATTEYEKWSEVRFAERVGVHYLQKRVIFFNVVLKACLKINPFSNQLTGHIFL